MDKKEFTDYFKDQVDKVYARFPNNIEELLATFETLNMEEQLKFINKVEADILDIGEIANTDLSGKFSNMRLPFGLKNLNVSRVTNMEFLFYNTQYDRNISNWDTSNVSSMKGMFANNHTFNKYIGNWDVSSVTNMAAMFANCYRFNQDISNWDISNLDNVFFMFKGSLITMDDLKSWGWLDQRPDLNWETAF